MGISTRHVHCTLYKSKNIFIKMLNNVGMAVPKIIQTRCSTYAARQWMIAYNNNNMRNPIIKDVGRGLHMLLFVCYHPLPCCICTAPCLYDFWHCHPYIVQHFNENVFTLVLLVFTIVFGSNKSKGSGATSKSGSGFGARTTEVGGGGGGGGETTACVHVPVKQ